MIKLTVKCEVIKMNTKVRKIVAWIMLIIMVVGILGGILIYAL